MVIPRRFDGESGRTSGFANASIKTPARNPVTPSGRGFRAKFFSPKNARLVRCESLLEFDCLHLFEFARDITTFVEQPMTIRYQLGRAWRRYTPDFSVSWVGGRRWLVEVKPAGCLAEEQQQEKFARLSEVFAAQGDQLMLLTDTQIRRATRLRQVKRLLQIRFGSWLEGLRPNNALPPLERRTIGEAFRGGETEQGILLRLATRELVCCLEQEISDTTLLLPFEESHDDALFI